MELNESGLVLKRNNMSENNTKYTNIARGRLAYKVSEVAELIGCHDSTVRNLVARGDLESVGNLRTLRISRESLERLLTPKREINEN